MAEACYKYGLKLGLYYSQDLDWHEPHGGGYLSGHIPCAGTAWCNDWDFPDNEKKDFDICFRNKIYPQVEEILRNYGELCLINSRLGNGAYDYVSLGDNEIPEHMPEQMEPDPSQMNELEGFKPSPYGLYETAATMNDSWGYCAWDQNWKDAKTIAANKKRFNGMGINYLLNVGPDGLGRFPAACQEILREVAGSME